MTILRINPNFSNIEVTLKAENLEYIVSHV